ncbi:MAG: HEAT repeat domain-containing protein [Polyangiaceae bacterium]|nr:HEAT repeat domain-containing protein [Polyangiaceae bacterium]
MRARVLAGLLFLAVPAASLVAPPTAHADFDPSGRGKKKPVKPGGGGGAVKKPKPKSDEDKKAQTTEAQIAKYMKIALEQPGQPFPVQKLSQLYRERDGNLKKLVEELEKKAKEAGDQWATRVVLAGVYKNDGRYDDAIKAYEAAITEKPKEPAAILALAQLKSDRGDKAGSRTEYEKALPLQKVSADVEQTTRILLALCLDLKDFTAAKKYHDALVKNAGGSLFVKAELGRELMSRGYYEKAEAEFRDLVKAASGDNRALAPALRDLGSSLAKQKKMKEALETLKKALSIAGSAAGVRNEILLIMTDAFRAESKLPELITILEAEKGTDFQRIVTMGALYEETGDVEKAIATYRKALSIDSKHIDTRVKLVHLLQTAGELEAAIKEYEALIKSAPNNPDFVFELCETLIQRGDRPKALKLLTDLESRVSSEPETLAAVADFYERVEEKDKAIKVLTKLANSAGSDPSHLIDLGDRYFQAGDKKKALETWARVKSLIPNKAKAAATLGEVYLDHDMVPEALSALREAAQLEPANARYKKALAIALERTSSSSGNPQVGYAEARQIWEELLAQNPDDKVLARDCRSHIVSLWNLGRELGNHVAPLTASFNKTPPDMEAGRLLAEVLRKLHRLPEAEATLRRIVTLAPGDEESLLSLERVLVQQQNLKGAIATLEKLVEVNPKRAREFYQRMAQYAGELYMDDDAITYAAKAVELSPNDATGHQNLAEKYKKRQDIPKAIAEYRLAISQNDRLFNAYFDLAELLLTTGQIDEADRLLRRVVRASTEEDLVARAARMSMQVNLGRASLDVLERELLPVAVGNPQKPIYRRLLVELYGAMTFPIVQKVRASVRRAQDAKTPAAAKEALATATGARAELSRIGARAIKPLLDALADDRESQQKIAIEVLAYVENKSAGPALFNFASGQADKGLRVRAMVACGALRDSALLPKLEGLLAPKEGTATVLPNDALAVAAAWGVARMGDKKAEPLLAKLIASPSPEVRALAAVGLGLTHDKKHAPALIALAKAPEAGPVARAAAVHALGELGGSGAGDLPLLQSVADSNEPVLRQAALLTMARLGQKEDATKSTGPAEAIAAGILSGSEQLRSTGALAAAALTHKSFKRAGDALPVPDGPLVVTDVLAGLSPDSFTVTERAQALIALAPALRKAAVAAVATSPARARVVADALLAGKDKDAVGLAPFVDNTDELDPRLKKEVEGVVETISAAVVAGFIALERHPDVEVRTRAVEVLAKRPEPAAQAAVIDALTDPDESVQRAALSALGKVKHEPTIAAVSKVARDSESWSLRVRAAEALGRLGAGTASKQVVETLNAAAQKDSFALVREAAARALGPVDKTAAATLWKQLAQSDAEPRVREAAADLLKAQ